MLTSFARAEMELPSETDPPEYDESRFGLHYPLDYVVKTWALFRKHGVMPRAGGYDDQPQVWIDDMDAMNTLYADVTAELMPEAENRTRPVGGGIGANEYVAGSLEELVT